MVDVNRNHERNTELENQKKLIDLEISKLQNTLQKDEDYRDMKDKKKIAFDLGLISIFSFNPILGTTVVICRNFNYTEAREITAWVCVVGTSLALGTLYSKHEYNKRKNKFNSKYHDNGKKYKKLTKEELLLLKNRITNLRHESYSCLRKIRNNNQELTEQNIKTYMKQ